MAAKKEEGNTAFRTGKFQDAYSLYTEALSIDTNNKSTNSKLFCNRATVCSKVCSKAVAHCLELDLNYNIDLPKLGGLVILLKLKKKKNTT